MARLIDAKAGKKAFWAIAQPAEYKGVIHMVVPISEIDKLPTVDAVEVVLCKECKHWSELNGKDSGKPVGYGDCRNVCGINGIAYEDSFCSYGERRTDG